MQNPKVSIIIPIYNVSKYIEKCLSSIVDQTLKDIEIILVNDCSPDPEDEQICLKFSAIDTRIIYVNHEANLGPGGARNTGIRLAKSDYISFVDSDDYIEPNMLEMAYHTAITNNSDIVTFGFNSVDEEDNIYDTVFPKDINNNNPLENFLLDKASVTPMIWDKLWKKTLFTDNNIFFPLNVFFEDMMILPRLLYFSNTITVLKEAYYFYLQRNDSTMQTMSKKHIDDAFFSYDYIANFLKLESKLEEYQTLLEKRIMRMMQQHIRISLHNTNDREDIIDYLAKKMATERPYDLKFYFPHRYYRS